ncbi:MAG: DUF3015 family protein [Halobacteriovoraceae bacterium]|jgi:hypothetical protein|nr:DUF3015 family protein [Halobacteriovoraceae bacterium]
MKFLFTVTVLASFSLLNTAVAAYGPAGCGLGANLMKDSKGLVSNVMAATTNGSSGNQTFGMTSGTSGCEVDDSTTVAAVNFIEGNKVAFAKDAALGNGETISALAKIYSCSNVEAFGTTIQSNYEAIFNDKASATINSNVQSAVITNKSCV